MSFQIADPNKTNGTCLIGYIEISPVNLIKKFGYPNMCDGYKVSGAYAFQDENGDVFTLYDWKYTTLYDSENTYTPEEFWKLKHPFIISKKKTQITFYFLQPFMQFFLSKLLSLFFPFIIIVRI